MSDSGKEHGQSKPRLQLQTTLAIVTQMGRDYRLGAKPRARAEGNGTCGKITLQICSQNVL